MTLPKIFIIGLVLSFISGILLVSAFPITINSVFASIENLYQTSQPPLPKSTDVTVSNCDFFGNNCQTTPITDDQREQIFDNWCYSIQNHYTIYSGKTSTTQYFRTMSHDCESFIMDQKLQPLNQKLDNLTAEIHLLESRLK